MVATAILMSPSRTIDVPPEHLAVQIQPAVDRAMSRLAYVLLEPAP